MRGKGQGEEVGKVILCVKPRSCEPSVFAALLEVSKLCIVLFYEGFAVSRDGPTEGILAPGFSLGRRRTPAKWTTSQTGTYSRALSRAMPYLRRLNVAMSTLPSSSLSILSGTSVSS